MLNNQQIFIPRHINYKDMGLVNKNTIDTEMLVVDINGKQIDSLMHNGQEYIPCKIGDTIICRYTKKEFTRNFKVVGLDRTEQFYICEPVYSKEDSVELELIELKAKVEKGEICPNKAHLKADDLLLELLNEKGFKRIVDAFVAIPKFYN